MSEAEIQSKIIKQLTKDGWLVVKLIKTNMNGIMDLMAIKTGEATFFIEVKTQKGVLSEIQKYRIDQFRTAGVRVEVWTDYNVNFLLKDTL
jgi:Holliday junction resolvase-like predicted endonuclease